MNLAKLPLASLPADEQEFVRSLQAASRVFYSLQFLGEQAVNNILASSYESWNRYSNVAIVRVGSGGRLEGGALGNTELIVFSRPAKSDADFRTEHLEKISEVLKAPVPLTGLNPPNPLGQQFARVSHVEHRTMDSSSPLSYYPGVSTPYPGRVLEAEFLAGNQTLWHEARVRVLGEVSSDPHLIKSMRAENKRYRATCSSGVNARWQSTTRPRTAGD